MAAPVDGGELGQESGPTPYHPDPALKTHPMLPMQFHSFDRSVAATVGPTVQEAEKCTQTYPSVDCFFQPIADLQMCVISLPFVKVPYILYDLEKQKIQKLFK